MALSDSPFKEQASTMSATFKHRGKYEDPWIVFHGTPSEIRENVIEAFDLAGEVAEGASVADVIYQADRKSKALYALATDLGAQVVKVTPPNGPTKKAPAEGDRPAEGKAAFIAEKIAEAENMDQVKEIWAEFSSDIKADSDLMAAFKARGKELNG